MIAMTFNGLGLLAVLAAVAVFWLAYHYLCWRTHDRYRRTSRRIHVNLMRQTGGPR